MLDTRTSQWLTRLQANGPNLVSGALAILIAAQLASLAIALLRTPVKSLQPVPSRPPPPRPAPGIDVQRVVAAHLFGTLVVEPTVQDPAHAPLSSANLQLAGTIATGDPKHGIAIISDGGPAKVYSVGEHVGGAALHSVYLDHVILDRAGMLETLLLPRLLAATAPGPVRRTAADPRTAAAVDNIRRMVQQDPGILDQVMRTVASYDNVAGKLRGFRAYPGKNRALFNKLGLKAGDLVTAINGQALDDPQRSQEVFNTIQSSPQVTVTLERGGQKQDLTLNIAQVAAQAIRELDEPTPPVPFNGAMPGTPPSSGVPGQPNSPNESPNEQ